MGRRLVLLLLALAVLALALDAAGILPLGLLSGGGPAREAQDPDLLGAGGDGEKAVTLEGLGKKGAAAEDAGAAAAEAAAPEMAAEVMGGTPGGGVVRGRVVQAAGRIPLRGVRVELSRFDSLISYLRAEVNGRYDVLEAQTGPDGRFAFLDVTPSKGYVVRARHEGFAVASSREEIDLRGRETVDLGDLELGAGATATGRVVDHEGRPAADVRVAATWRITNPLGIVLSDPDLAPGIELETRTDAEGRFQLEQLEALPTSFFFLSPAGASAAIQSVSLEEGQTKALEDVKLPGKHFLAGTVAWSDGTPIAGARVFAAPQDQNPMKPTRPTTSGSDGRWRIDWLPEDASLGLGILVPGMPVQMEMGVGLDRDDVEIVFPTPGRLEGVVVRARSGKPIPRFRIHVDSQKPPEDFILRFVATQVRRGLGATPFQAADGRFAFPRVAPGTYTVLVSADGYPQAKRADVVVTAKETTEIRVEVAEGHVARGTVRRAGGDPAGGARLYVIHGGVKAGQTGVQLQGYFGDREPDAVAGADGAFELPPQTPGTYDLIADHPDALPVAARGVDLRAGDAADVDLRLGPAGRVVGRLLDEHARPAADETVYVLYRNGFVRFARLEDDGRFDLGGLPTGRCLVRWMSILDAGTYGRFMRGSDAEAKEAAYDELRLKGEEHEIVDGGTVTITLRLPPRTKVSGRLVVSSAPEEQAGGFWVTAGSQGHWKHVRTDKDGRYEVRLEPGTYQAFIPVKKHNYAGVEMVVPDAATATIDLGQ